MYDLFFMTTPNVYKIVIALEEIGTDYRVIPVDISTLQHRDPSHLAGSLTGKVPVLVDHAPSIGQAALTIAESGAILHYLAEKHSTLLPDDPVARQAAMQWLIWQVAGLGPFSGQCFHFRSFAPVLAPDIDKAYSEARYEKILTQHWDVLEARLSGRDYLADDYSVADIACYPWIEFMEPREGRAAYPQIEAWRARIAGRRAVVAAYERSRTVKMGDRAKNGQDIFMFSPDELGRIIAT